MYLYIRLKNLKKEKFPNLLLHFSLPMYDICTICDINVLLLLEVGKWFKVYAQKILMEAAMTLNDSGLYYQPLRTLQIILWLTHEEHRTLF